MKNTSDVLGILVVDKPMGLTSRDVVNIVSKELHTKKIGHTGTLDPLATGVLVLTIGKCTKLGLYLTSKYKEYICEFSLGYESDTLDVTGEVLKESTKVVSEEEIEKCIKGFIGTYLQEVPAYSAVKVSGRRLYDYARAHEQVELPKRTVDIASIEILSIDYPKVTIKTTVSKGTYIRSLVRDIGRKVGTYATMTSLRRTRQGKFGIDEAYSLEDIQKGNYCLLHPLKALDDIIVHELKDEEYKKVVNGVKMNLPYENEFVAFVYQLQFIAIYKNVDGIYKMLVKIE